MFNISGYFYSTLNSLYQIKKGPFCDYLLMQGLRIQQIATSIFSSCYQFFYEFNYSTHEFDIKAVAMLSCLSLIALLVFSLFRRGRTAETVKAHS